MENAKTEVQKTFQFEDELNEKSVRLALLDSELNIDSGEQEKAEEVEQESDTTQEPCTALVSKGKPSILEGLKVTAKNRITSDKSNSVEISM